MANLVSPRDVVTSLISSLAATPASASTTTATSNPLQSAPPQTQKILLTIHVLFPNELLPALDLLDRGLVTRFVLAHNPTQEGNRGENGDGSSATYYVRSAQPQTRHRSAVAHVTSYEVRLDSWSCSCPAFVFAAFPADSRESSARQSVDQNGALCGNTDWTVGGLTRGTDMPICKHLLACVLVERAEMFKGLATEQVVSVEELAGWAAGWCD